MESHKDVLAEVGIDVDHIKAPDLCVVGEYMGPTGELNVLLTLLSLDGSVTFPVIYCNFGRQQ